MAEQSPATEVARARYLMGTVLEATAHAGDGSASARRRVGDLLDAALEEVARLEAILSDYRPDSELSRLNRQSAASSFSCSRDLYKFLEAGSRYSALTSGAFDLTVAPLVGAWGLRGERRQPPDQELAEVMQRVGYTHVRLDSDRRTVQFEADGMGLDPGALGKGHALDAAARILRSHGITSALLDFGGQILAVGAPPGRDAWPVGVADPRDREEVSLAVELSDASLATSGNAEKGVHVVDPRTGRPVITRGSVTVIAADASTADAVSTALLVMGPEEGAAWARRHDGIDALFLMVDDAGEVRPAGTGRFTENLPEGTDAPGIK